LLRSIFEAAVMPIASIELPDEVEPLPFAAGDLIQILFHLRGERDVDQIAEMRAQQTRDGERGETGHQRFALTEDVAAPLDRANRRRVGRRPADPEALELLNERRLRVARRRCGLVTLRFKVEQMEPRGLGAFNDVTYGQFGQRAFLLAKLGDRIVAALDVRAPEPAKLDNFARR